MTRTVALFRLTFCLIGCVATTSCGPALPPLLEGASARGGLYGGCPRPAPVDKQALALSPELDGRLRQQFPPGTSESKLSATLVVQGFVLGPRCEKDNSIRVANYTLEADGFYSLYRTDSSVFWKVDGQGNIVWTEGFLMFIGL
ncbi:hypothetical protein [Mesorhizobium sp. 43Arga]